MADGIPAKQLSDDDLRRELAHLKETEQDIMSGGTPHQKTNHRERTTQLEAEFLERFGSQGSKVSANGSRDTAAGNSAGEGTGRGTVPGAGDPPAS